MSSLNCFQACCLRPLKLRQHLWSRFKIRSLKRPRACARRCLPGLLQSVRHNLNHGIRDVRLFEIGRVFAGFRSSEVSDKLAAELPSEREALGLIATGGAIEEGHAQATREIDFYELKGALEAAVDATKLAPLLFSKANFKHLRKGQSAAISLADGTAIGSIGRLAESIATSYKFRQPLYVAELDLTALLDSNASLHSVCTVAAIPGGGPRCDPAG